ncbi:MAG: hypothetical protein HKN05_14245 [Rhizobiales bacterium]|nr:hypothetical protein [Hyphomicrobiales bacterium]
MQFAALCIFVDDIAAARTFYHDGLGLPLVRKHEDNAFGPDAGASLVVETVPQDAPAEDRAMVGRFIGCSLKVDDMDGEYERLQADGVRFHGAPAKQYWGGTLAHFDDPSGNVLTLVSD